MDDVFAGRMGRDPERVIFKPYIPTPPARTRVSRRLPRRHHPWPHHRLQAQALRPGQGHGSGIRLIRRRVRLRASRNSRNAHPAYDVLGPGRPSHPARDLYVPKRAEMIVPQALRRYARVEPRSPGEVGRALAQSPIPPGHPHPQRRANPHLAALGTVIECTTAAGQDARSGLWV